MKRTPTQILYILQNGNTNQFKIGITDNLNRRMAQLQTGCPYQLRIIKLYQHYRRDIIERYERVLHRYYTACGCRIRDNGEWFELSISDLNYLCEPQTITEQNQLISNLLKMMP